MFFSVLGGLRLFGPVGIIMGPIVVAVAMGLMRIFEESVNEADAAIKAEKGEPRTPPAGLGTNVSSPTAVTPATRE